MAMNKTNAENKIRVLIADDHGIMRKGLELIISDAANIQIVAQADTGLKAIEMARRLSPDIVLMDISMPGLNGIDAAKQIRLENPDIKIHQVCSSESQGAEGFGVTAIIVGISLYIVTKEGGEVPSPDHQDSQAN